MEMIGDLIKLIGLLLLLIAPFVAIVWILYRLVKGSGGNNNSITGN
ncbi:MAG TPA: hypothetical protein PKY82_18190 [Pyrinomonadaceae bacterium]|nr:hypothetical protein [Pyrinomonadaceae bacterium]